jgi:hypothetical protein
MTGFSASNRAVFVVAVPLLAAGVALAAQAQPFPQPPPSQAPEAAPLWPDQPPQYWFWHVPGAPVDKVVTTTLTPPDPTAAGTLDDKNGGLGQSLWQGSRRETIEQMIPELPADLPLAVNLPVARALGRRLLLTQATPPEGQPNASLLGLRAERLAAGGAWAEIAELSKLVSAPPDDSLFARSLAQAELIAGNFDAACRRVEQQLTLSADSFWPRAAIFCQARLGRMVEAELGLSLAREHGEDQEFLAVAEALLFDRDQGLDRLASLDPLMLAMLTWADRPVPVEAARNATAAIAAAIATAPKVDSEARLEAIERAAAFATIPAEKLREAYATLALTQAERSASPDRIAAAPRQAAVLYQLAMAESPPVTRSQDLAKALAFARSRGLFAITAQILAPSLQTLAPLPETLPAAGEILRAHIANGAMEHAINWWSAIYGAARGGDAKALAIEAEHWGAVLLAGLWGVYWNDNDFARWLGASARPNGAVQEEHGRLLLSLAQALGIAVPEQKRESLALNTASAESLTLRYLDRAAAENRRGETVLLALIAIGDAGPGKSTAIARAIVGLRRVGLDREARQIALDVLLRRGL